MIPHSHIDVKIICFISKDSDIKIKKMQKKFPIPKECSEIGKITIF
jgi:hypothetical protein